MAVIHKSKQHVYDFEFSRYFRNIEAGLTNLKVEPSTQSRWTLFGKTLSELLPAIVVLIAAVAALIFLLETTPE